MWRNPKSSEKQYNTGKGIDLTNGGGTANTEEYQYNEYCRQERVLAQLSTKHHTDSRLIIMPGLIMGVIINVFTENWGLSEKYTSSQRYKQLT